MKKEAAERIYRRHRVVYAILRTLVTPFLKLKFNLTCDPEAKTEGPFLMLANHNTNWDPLLTSVAVHSHLYYVASEHIFRWGFLSKLINWLVAPIPRTKGSVESAAALAIMRHLKKGHSVGMFAEGNRSFNGLTGPAHPSTAKLVKRAGVKLVTLRMEGGYFTSPRWSESMRRGSMHIAHVGTYEPEALKAMSESEISALIERDLYEDAYARDAMAPKAYKGKRLAEYLETALYICPCCGGLGTMRSEDDKLLCSCGESVTYLPTGELSGGRFSTITTWDAWQRERLNERIDASEGGLIASDSGVSLNCFNAEHEVLSEQTGDIELYADGIVAAGRRFAFSELSGFSIYSRNVLVFTYEGEHYEIKGDKRMSGLKYLHAYEKATA